MKELYKWVISSVIALLLLGGVYLLITSKSGFIWLSIITSLVLGIILLVLGIFLLLGLVGGIKEFIDDLTNK